MNIVSIKMSKYETDLGGLKEFVQQLHPTDIIQNSKLHIQIKFFDDIQTRK